jgi:hypothetical protein
LGVAGLREDRALDLADALAWVRADAEREAAGLPRTVHTDLGAANDDDDQPPRSREHIYDFAPASADLPGADDEEHGPLACEDEEGEEMSEEEAAALEERAWATVRAAALARAEQDGCTEAEIDDMIAFARRRSARSAPARESAPRGAEERAGPATGEPPPPPDVARASSTSGPPDETGDPPPMGGLWR